MAGLIKAPLRASRTRAAIPENDSITFPSRIPKSLSTRPPDWVWRTIIALSRYGGLRNPSEVLSLQLAGLDWQRGGHDRYITQDRGLRAG